MFYINYDLAMQIAEDRRAVAMRASTRRRGAHTRRVVTRSEKHAEVIELAFGTHCEPERVGA